VTEPLSTFDNDPKRRPPLPGTEPRDVRLDGSPEQPTDLVDLSEVNEIPKLAALYDPATGDLSVYEPGIVGSTKQSPKQADSLGFKTIDSDEPLSFTMPTRIGDYVIERMLGSGGMGRVYLAKHQTMQRTVAIKTLPPEQTASSWAIDRFHEEVRAAARLLHPNIATAFDAGNSNGVHFLAMEYIDGQTLTHLVAQGGPMAIGEAVSAIRGAARGLAHAHLAGVIHRDVKPSNLMRTRDGTIKVVDLGLALFANPQTAMPARGDAATRGPGRLLGTVAFMSPEQLENPDFVDARSDIFSLGATLYFLLTGRPPFEGEFLEQIRGIRHDPVPELFALRPDVDLRLEHVFRRMMAKRPQERYASLVEVIADLAAHDTGETGTDWMGNLSAPRFLGDSSTHRGGSTGGEIAKVMGIDLGMFYATCASADPTGNINVLTPDGDARAQSRLAIADGQPLLFGEVAAARRELQPGSVLHCIPLYIGQSKVDHLINGRQCPAEVLLAMQIRNLIDTRWRERVQPHAVAITVPSCYDQFHRQAVIQAATIAGIRSVRLVDRSMAILQSWRYNNRQTTSLDSAWALKSADGKTPTANYPVNSPVNSPANSPANYPAYAHGERPQVVVSITGNATEVVISRYRGSRIQQLSAVGQWHHGTLQWQQKLIDKVAEACVVKHGFDPRHTLQSATQLQVACERALPKFLLLESVNVSFQSGAKPIAFAISRGEWLDACEPLMQELIQMIELAIEAAEIKPERVSHCLLLGLITRIGDTRKRIEKCFGPELLTELVERTDVARGAALCVAGELPGRGDIPLPPQSSTTHDFALLVVDAKNRRRIRPIIPRGTAIPARTNRRIASGSTTPQVLTVVESSTWRETSWRSLGSHRFDNSAENASQNAVAELTFEVNVDGLLIIRRRDPNSGGFAKLPTLPQATLSDEEVQQWTEWVKDWMPITRRRTPQL